MNQAVQSEVAVAMGRGTPSFKRIDVKELTGIPGIEKADVDGDGFIDVNELVAVITKQKEQKSTNKILKCMLLGLFVTLLITIGAVTGLTYFVVSTLKDSKVDSSNGQQPVLTTKSGAPIATDQLLYKNKLEASLFYAPMEELIKVEQLAWDQGTENNTLQSFFKISGFVRTNIELRFFTDAGEIVLTPEGSISVEPPAWCASQFYQAALQTDGDNNINNNTNATANSGARRSLLSESSDHPLHNGLLTGFSVSPEALGAHQGRQLQQTGGSAYAYSSALLTVLSLMNIKQRYSIRVVTADEEYAGTDSNVQINIYGTLGETGFVTLGGSFERGQVEKFIVLGKKNVGKITSITIKKDSAGLGPDWLLKTVEIWSYNPDGFYQGGLSGYYHFEFRKGFIKGTTSVSEVLIGGSKNDMTLIET